MIYTNIKEVDANTIKILINDSSVRHAEIYKLYERYKGSKIGVPILNRRYYIGNVEQVEKINNKIANDFIGEIIDTKVGFFCGVPIVYTIDKDAYSESDYDKNLEYINTFNKLNSIADLDSETAKMAAICGYCGRLLYMSEEEGQAIVRAQLVNPWELIFISSNGMDEPTYTIRYYTETRFNEKGERVEIIHAELYDSVRVQYFVREGTGTDYKFVTEKPDYIHMMGFNPLIGFPNNDELLGDAEKVLSEIDGYDRTISDVNSELEQFRLSYLGVYGAQITTEQLELAKQTGAFSIPGDGKIEFIVKSLDDGIIEHHLDRLEENIYRFSRTPNMNDESFGGNLSGVAMAFKFRPFEYKCKTLELKFENSLREQYNILCGIWNAKGANINYLDVDFIFTRNYPQNLLEEAQIQTQLKGVVSEKTRLAQASFIDDPEAELDALNEDNKEAVDLMRTSFEENKDTQTEDDEATQR